MQLPFAAFQAVLFFLAFAEIAHAEKRALLIGIGEYAPESGVRSLEGPREDVAALRQALLGTWNFVPANVETLLNQRATKANVLLALEGLAANVHKGDYVFIYFSGHGTNAYDKDAAGRVRLGLEPYTGALLPADIHPGTAEEISVRLLVGMRDLSPVFSRISAKAEVFVVFDTCYSGMTARGGPGVPKGVSFRSLVNGQKQEEPSIEDDEKRDTPVLASNEPPFPYSNLLYISAASKFEEAKDIPSAQLALRPTIDAKPHGALTNALLKGMSGEADANHDGEITYNEIYQYVQFEVSRDFKHFPQMLQPIAGGMETRAAFGGRPIRMDRPRPRESGVTLVKLRTGGDDLRAGLLRIASVRLSDGYYDLLIEETRSGYDLIHKSGNLMKHYDKEASAELLRRIGRQTLVDKLIDARFSKQNFNASIRVLPETKGTYYGGELLQLEAISEKEGCPLVLNIDVTGTVIVVYPLLDEQSKRLQAGVRTILGRDIEVLAPFGLEYLKLLVIAGDTKVCAEWAGKSLTPDNPEFDKLLALAQSSESGRAQTSLRLFSRER